MPSGWAFTQPDPHLLGWVGVKFKSGNPILHKLSCFPRMVDGARAGGWARKSAEEGGVVLYSVYSIYISRLGRWCWFRVRWCEVGRGCSVEAVIVMWSRP